MRDTRPTWQEIKREKERERDEAKEREEKEKRPLLRPLKKQIQ